MEGAVEQNSHLQSNSMDRDALATPLYVNLPVGGDSDLLKSSLQAVSRNIPLYLLSTRPMYLATG